MVTNIEQFKQRKNTIQKIDKIIIIISILMLAIVPNVMHRKDINSYTPIIAGHPYATGSHMDVFNYYKSVLINVGAFLMMGLYSYKVIVLKEQIKKNVINIVIPALGFVILLSAILSDYPSIAFFGNHDRFEGSLSWISYLMIFFVLFNTNIESKYYKFYYIALIPFIILNSVFSISYIYGKNLLEQEWLNNFLGGGLNGFIITTLYNQNFGSGISAVIFSVSFMYLLFDKNIWVKLGLLLMTLLSYAMLLCMMSMGGFLTILVTVPIIIMTALRFGKFKDVGIFVPIVFVANNFIYKILNAKNTNIGDNSFAIFDKLEEISPSIVVIAFIVFFVILAILMFSNKKRVTDGFCIFVAVVITVGFVSFSSAVKNNKEELVANAFYQKLNLLSTYRIEIWTETVDLINNHMLLGNGMDTFPYDVHENGDNKGIVSYGAFMDKPHNWYLTILQGSGIFALIFVLFVILYFTREIFVKICEKIEDKFLYIFGIGAIAYAVQGLTNDSFVGTSIFFWILIAISFNKDINNINSDK